MFHTYEFDACLRAGLLAEQAKEMHQAGRTPNARIDPATDAIERLDPDEVGKLAGILHMAAGYYETHARHWWAKLRERERERDQVRQEGRRGNWVGPADNLRSMKVRP